jgi:hypothetical protein
VKISWISKLIFVMFLFCASCQCSRISIPDSPEGTVETIVENLNSGKTEVIWEAMPRSYQEDVNSLVSDFAGKMDEELWSKGFGVVRKLIEVTRKQKDFIFNTPMMNEFQEVGEQKDLLFEKWDDITEGLDILEKSEFSDLDKLKKFDGQKFFSGTLKKMSKIGDGFEDIPGFSEKVSLSDLKVEKTEQKGDEATLKITIAEEITEQKMVKVEGRWVPKDLADKWKETMDSARESLSEMSQEDMWKDKTKYLSLIAAVDTVLDQLIKAKTQAEFDAIIMSMLGGGLF